MIVVSDASPLIALAAIGRFDLLPALYGEVLIPKAVYEEVVVRGSGEPGADEVRMARWLHVEEAPHPSADLLENLDRGEAEAIALAAHRKAERVLIDERRGRRAAQAHGLHVIGTLGVLIEAKRRGLESELRPALDALRAHGSYLSEHVVEQALRSVSE